MKSTKECPMEKNVWNWKSIDKKGIHVTVISKSPNKNCRAESKGVYNIQESCLFE